MEPITLIEALGSVSVQNRRLDESNAFDAALSEFLFKWNLKSRGMSESDIESLWRQHTGG